METKQQIIIMGGGLMVAFGFMFMGAASFAGLTPDGAPNQGSGGGEQIDAELPEENYADGSFGLGINEQLTLSVNHQVIFVNAIYEDDDSVFDDLEGIEEDFDGRVYYSKVNASESEIATELQIGQYPEVVVVGDQPTQQTGYTITRADANRESVTSAICSAMRDVGDAAAICF